MDPKGSEVYVDGNPFYKRISGSCPPDTLLTVSYILCVANVPQFNPWTLALYLQLTHNSFNSMHWLVLYLIPSYQLSDLQAQAVAVCFHYGPIPPSMPGYALGGESQCLWQSSWESLIRGPMGGLQSWAFLRKRCTALIEEKCDDELQKKITLPRKFSQRLVIRKEKPGL